MFDRKDWWSKYNPENSFTTKLAEHITSGLHEKVLWLHEYCMKKCCESLREQAVKTINFKKKKLKLLTKEQKESYENSRIWYICTEKLENKDVKGKKYSKVRDHCHYTGEYRGASDSTCNLKYSVPKSVPKKIL